MDGSILKSFNLPRPRLICIYKLFDVEMKCTAASVVENLSLFSLSLAPNDALLHSIQEGCSIAKLKVSNQVSSIFSPLLSLCKCTLVSTPGFQRGPDIYFLLCMVQEKDDSRNGCSDLRGHCGHCGATQYVYFLSIMQMRAVKHFHLEIMEIGHLMKLYDPFDTFQI